MRYIILLLMLTTALVVPLQQGDRAHASPQEAVRDADHRPRLIVVIVVDQLRGDMPLRMRDRFGEGGLRVFLDHGAWYADAHLNYNNTVTGVGHASVATGGYPVDHGVVGNEWADRATGAYIYCVEDQRYAILDGGASRHAGTSPANLRSSTIGDELIQSSAGGSRVFSVSVKDRGAILPAGHRGVAYWYDDDTGRFVTSDYYMDAYPGWVRSWNEANHAMQYRDAVWNLSDDPASYTRIAQDDRPFENEVGSLGRTFPHVVAGESDRRIAHTIKYTPFGDALTVDFAIKLLEEEQLGRRGSTDMLFLGLSSTDAIGHAFGPNSLEVEDNLLHLDRTIARLLARVDNEVGLDQTLLVLTADHGIAASPEYRFERAWQRVGGRVDEETLATPEALDAEHDSGDDRTETPGRLDPADVVDAVNTGLSSAFGLNRRFVRRFLSPNIYFDHDALRDLGVDASAAEAAAQRALAALPGVRRAFPRTAILAGDIPDNAISKQVTNGYDPDRSGDLVLVLEPGWSVSRPGGSAATHGSPYTYDTHVPVAFAGWAIRAQRYERRIDAASIAATLARLLRIPAPDACATPPLVEVVE